MAHLMKLELKKLHFKNYFLILALAILLSIFFISVALHDSSDSVYTFTEILRVIEMIFSFVFIIFFSVLNASIIISEYNHKTILIMFTYPIDRRKLMLAKLLLITSFIAASMLIGYAVCGSFIVCMDNFYDWIEGEFEAAVLYHWISRAVSTTIVFCALGLWTYVVGMWKKSVPMTIVSSILFINLRQFVIASTDTYQENIWIILAAVIIALAGVWYTFAKRM